MDHDIDETLSILADGAFVPASEQEAVREMAARWSAHRTSGRICTVSNGFWTQPVPYGQLPDTAPELLHDLQKSGLVIFKGAWSLTRRPQLPQTHSGRTVAHHDAVRSRARSASRQDKCPGAAHMQGRSLCWLGRWPGCTAGRQGCQVAHKWALGGSAVYPTIDTVSPHYEILLT